LLDAVRRCRREAQARGRSGRSGRSGDTRGGLLEDRAVGRSIVYLEPDELARSSRSSPAPPHDGPADDVHRVCPGESYAFTIGQLATDGRLRIDRGPFFMRSIGGRFTRAPRHRATPPKQACRPRRTPRPNPPKDDRPASVLGRVRPSRDAFRVGLDFDRTLRYGQRPARA